MKTLRDYINLIESTENRILFEDIKSVMAGIMSDDKMVTGYQLQGTTLVLSINNNRPITDLKHYGFDDNYKRSLMQQTGVQNVIFQPAVDPSARSVQSQLRKR